MNYLKLTKFDVANGTGIRDVLWVTGCPHGCENCHNPETHDPTAGQPITRELVEEIIQDLRNPYVAGLTISGGDPLAKYNRRDTEKIVRQIKRVCPDKTIWIYTGFLYYQVRELPVMKYIDVLVDGPFVEQSKNLKLKWKGSSNQNVIDMKKSAQGPMILYEDNPPM